MHAKLVSQLPILKMCIQWRFPSVCFVVNICRDFVGTM